MSRSDPNAKGVESSPRIVSCAALGYYFDYMKSKGMQKDVLIQGLPYPPQLMEKPFHRIDYKTFLEIERRMEALFPDTPSLHYELGRYYGRMGGHGWMRLLIRSVMTPTAAYVALPRAVRMLFPFVRAEMKRRGTGHVRATYSYEPGFEPSKPFVEMVRGILTGTPAMFDLPEATVVMSRKGAQVFVYDVQYREYSRSVLGMMSAAAGWARSVMRMRYAISNEAVEKLTRTNEILEEKVEDLQAAQDELTQANVRLKEEIRQREAEEKKRRALQKSLVRKRKLEAIGKLAGGVAHDMNNILSVVMGVAELAKKEGSQTSTFFNDMDSIIAACLRGKDLTNNLLSFAREGELERKKVDLNEVLGEVERLLSRSTLKRIDFFLDTSPEPLFVAGDEGQLTQVFLNLTINALDAMGRSGELHLQTSRQDAWRPPPLDRDHDGTEQEQEPAPVPAPTAEKRPAARVCIRDTGPGMDPEVLDRVMEPFFTTKPKGEGTGLGLSVAYGIVKQHGGEVVIQSHVDEGTSVSVWLPLLGEDEAHAAESDTPPITGDESSHQVAHRADGGSDAGLEKHKTVLLVDDEPMIRELGRRILEAAGATVLEAEGGEQALALYGKHEVDIDLVLLDMMMPEMDGAETFRGLKALDPEVVVYVVSGYGEPDTIRSLMDGGVRGFVRKPFHFEELADLV